MTVHRLMVVAVAVLCACALVAAGCGSEQTTMTTCTEATSSDATPTESVGVTGASGLYPVSVDGKWGYIDNTGTIKIEPRFTQAADFSEGLAWAEAGANGGSSTRTATGPRGWQQAGLLWTSNTS
jgi:ABC-type phosphate transport system substrate-binding protein